MLFNKILAPNEQHQTNNTKRNNTKRTTPNETTPNEHYQTKQNALKSKNDKIFKKMTKKKNAFML
ncbi:hypothetical protein E5L03_04500 [Helicobacter pylori]|nr:hypothetical protein E5L03_04500 [Helicobacter pylori]